MTANTMPEALRKMLEETLDPSQLVAIDRDPATRTTGARPAARPRPWTALTISQVTDLKVANYKQCNCCGRILSCGTAEEAPSYGDFGRDNAMKDGRKGSCRECCTQQSRESTSRTRGKTFECTSTDPAVLAVFPSFTEDAERAKVWAEAHPESSEPVASRPRSSGGQRRQQEALAPPDNSPLAPEAGESGVIDV